MPTRSLDSAFRFTNRWSCIVKLTALFTALITVRFIALLTVLFITQFTALFTPNHYPCIARFHNTAPFTAPFITAPFITAPFTAQFTGLFTSYALHNSLLNSLCPTHCPIHCTFHCQFIVQCIAQFPIHQDLVLSIQDRVWTCFQVPPPHNQPVRFQPVPSQSLHLPG